MQARFLRRSLRSADVARFVAEHYRYAVADWEGEAGGLADEFVVLAVVGKRRTRHGADEHFQQARVRAVETGRYLVRAANTGISGIVDPYGRIVVQSPLFETGTWVGEVRWLDGTTPYVRIGDAVAWASMLVLCALLALPVWERLRARRATSGNA